MVLKEDYEYPTEGQHWKPIDLANYFNFSLIHIQNKCKSGEIKATKDGTRWRIADEEVQKMIARGSLLPPKPTHKDRIDIEVPPDKVELVFPPRGSQNEPPGEKPSWLRDMLGI